MDVYSSVYDFIESDAIREYLIKIHYCFTTPEAAFLVWYCKSATLKKKFAAWENIIETMPDCGMLKRFNMEAIPDFHVFLRKYIDLQKNYIRRFKTAGKGLYFYSFDDNDFNFGPYENFQACIESALKNVKEYDDVKEIRIALKKINPTYCSNEIAVCRLNTEGEFLQIEWWTNDGPEDDIETNTAFEGMWFDFPTPFQAGDILCQMTDVEEEHPIVLEHLSPWEIKEIAQVPGSFVSEQSFTRDDKRVHRLYMKADNSDMRAYGYQIEYDGFNQGSSMYLEIDDFGCADYLELTYCKKPLKGYNSMLLPVSLFLKKEIDLEILMNSYLMDAFQYSAENVKSSLTSWIDEEYLNRVGLTRKQNRKDTEVPNKNEE